MSDDLDFHAAIAQLVARGFAPYVAEQQVRSQMPHIAPPLVAAPDASVPEKAEQVEVRKRFVAFGFKIYNLSQARAAKQTPGLPDLWVVHEREPLAFWFETKRQIGGEFSKAQVAFRDECVRTGVLWFGGDRYAADQAIVDLGIAIRIDGRLEPAHLYAPRNATPSTPCG